MSNRTTPGVRYATLTIDDTAEVTSLYLHSHAEIDTEIDERIRLDRVRGCDRIAYHETTRVKFHAALEAQLSETGQSAAA